MREVVSVHGKEQLPLLPIPTRGVATPLVLGRPDCVLLIESS